MRSTRVNVEHMPKMIQVRNVPDDLHRTLKARAAEAGMSLSDYIKRELEQSAARPTFEEFDRRVQARGKSGVRTETTLSILREARGD
jgi:antitoxin FitA